MSGKRANIFGQGRPERPYDEREEEAAEVPQRATAAQLATRKIKTAKIRRPAGAASTPSTSAALAPPKASSFTFGASAPAVGGTSAASDGVFGGAISSSFPPAQSAAPSNGFASSSLAAFGANTQSTAFNPQPPAATSFNFSAGGTTTSMFGGAINAPAINGTSNGAPAFGGGSIFGSQTPSNPFGSLSQGTTSSAPASGSLFGTTSSAPTTTTTTTTNLFGTATSTPSTSIFGTSSLAATATSTPAPASASFAFGAPAQNNPFSGFSNNTQNGVSTQKETPQSNMFGAGSGAQTTQNTTTTAPAASLFGFSANTQPGATTSSAPASNMFGATTFAPASNMFGTAGTTSTAPASNMFAPASTSSSASTGTPFGSLPKPAESSTTFKFGQQTQNPASAAASSPFSTIKLPTESAETAKPSLFGSINVPAAKEAGDGEPVKENLFGGLAKPPPQTSTSGFTFPGATKIKDTTPTPEKSVEAAKAPEASKPSLFSGFGGFSTPQPAKTAESDKTKAGMFTAQPKTSTGLFSKPHQPETSNASNKAASSFTGFKSQAPSSAASTKNTTKQAASAQDVSNPFSKPSTPSTDRPNLFSTAKQQASTPAPTPSSSVPPLAGGVSTNGSELPQIPRAQVPQEWNAASVSNTPNGDNLINVIITLTAQLQQLNEKYRAKIISLSPTADWSSLSLWHHQHSSAIKKKIDIAKKQRANAKGITGNESTVTKRKVDNESPENRQASPTKRARPTEAPATPTPQPSASTPKLNPPATATSNLFANALSKKSTLDSEQNSLFGQKTAQSSQPELAKTPAQGTGFIFKPAATPAAASVSGGFKPTLAPAAASVSGGFKPTLTPAAASVSGGFKPTPTPRSALASGKGGFTPSVSSSSGSFASQFAASAKTVEQLAAERKKKAMDEDYDSDEETKAEWSARYDKKEAERIAKEKAAAASAKGFSMPASGTPTNGLFGSRAASPASSAGGSVLEAASTAHTPSSNIFGHLSSGASPNHQEDSDEGEQGSGGPVEPTTPPKRKFGGSETEDSQALDEAAKRQKQESAKGSLLSRMTRSEDDVSDNDNNSAPLFGQKSGTQTPLFGQKSGTQTPLFGQTSGTQTPLFGQTSGTQTPPNKPFTFFDFSAAGSKTAPAKSDTFVGDQTFKAGTPIKFGESAAVTEKKAGPVFQFQAPSNSTTPSKAPPTTLFNFAGASGGSTLAAPNAGLGSAPSSVFSSRAATPLSEADTSAADDEDEEGKQEQVDLSKLTAEELAANDVVFETEQALAKHQVDQGKGKTWENFARGPLYILKDKVSGKCFVRIRIASGATPLNYSILPKLKTAVTGNSGKMVQATMPKKEGGIAQYFVSLKTAEIAKEFSDKYNASLPS
ncbi:hypothetical protein ACEQ8H_001682 [Pleosporales sp. CAS-2024a]